jgi:protein gp37
MARRLDSRVEAYAGTTSGSPVEWTGQVNLVTDRLSQPKRWRKPSMVFVDSMSDLFHPQVPHEFIDRVFTTMNSSPRHTFLVLTKRPHRMANYLSQSPVCRVVPNVWLGTSIEDERYKFRADQLRHIPATVRFLSLEPLLGPIPTLDLTGIGWVIVGGESGPGARPMNPDWVRHIRDRCIEARVPFFFKQWGEWQPPTTSVERQGVDSHSGMVRVGKTAAGRVLDGRIWNQTPDPVTA